MKMRNDIFIVYLCLSILIIGFASFYKFAPTKVYRNTVTPVNTKTTPPYITEPKENSIVVSPLTIKGKVPAGWMFEGSFPIKILDSNKKVVATGNAKETTPGSWQSGKDVEFTAEVKFKTNSSTGFIVLEKDNPSGLPENDKSYEMPIRFKELLSTYKCPESGWVDCMPTVGGENKNCTKEAMDWYKTNCPNFQGGAY